ncbi:MAG: AAA family ATPase [Candidatus Micrarchaeia archaeon]
MVNPFTPGNGIEPRYLAGRERHIGEFIKSLQASEDGLPRNMVLYGLRGTGKTVLLRHYGIIAETKNWVFVDREFNERYCDEAEFAQMFGKDLVTLASEVSIKKRITETGKKILDFLKPEELSAYGIRYRPYYEDREGILEDYIREMLQSNWSIFEKADKKGVVFFYDEFHSIKDRKEEKQYVLSSLLGALSRVQREGYRYYLCLSGLPAIKTNLKEAKTYSERMFIFQDVGNLNREESRKALLEPLSKTHYSFENELVDRIIDETKGYPYFIQFYGYFLVDAVGRKSIKLGDLETNKNKLLEMLDKSFFEDRFNLASETEKKVLVSMAKCGGDKVSAAQLKKKVRMSYKSLQQYLFRLIDKGLIYRAQRGFYSFSIPLFRDYLLRQS